VQHSLLHVLIRTASRSVEVFDLVKLTKQCRSSPQAYYFDDPHEVTVDHSVHVVVDCEQLGAEVIVTVAVCVTSFSYVVVTVAVAVL